MNSENVPWRLRPAAPADLEWAYELHRAALREYIEPIWGWDEDLQRRMFTDRYDARSNQVIQVDGQDVGVLVVEERAEELYVSRMELLPAWQGKGVGTSILGSLLHRAHASGRPVGLHVLKTNARATELYERVGLRVVALEPVKLMMRSTPLTRDRGTPAGTGKRTSDGMGPGRERPWSFEACPARCARRQRK